MMTFRLTQDKDIYHATGEISVLFHIKEVVYITVKPQLLVYVDLRYISGSVYNKIFKTKCDILFVKGLLQV